MEITTRQTDDGLELAASGRLDAYWADHLAKALDDALRGGAHEIRVDMSAVPYMSSVGIRVLLRFYKELERLNGSFAVVRPSEAVKTVLELAGLELLLAGPASAGPASAASGAPVREIETANATLEVYDIDAAATLRCRAIGRPGLLEGCRFGTADVSSVRFPESSFGIGVGAFGQGYDDCRARFGEFLAAAGAAACLPTDGSNVPDEFVSSKALVPEVQLLYGLVCEGAPGRLLRFEAKAEAGVVALPELLDGAFTAADGASTIGIVMVAESAGLIGASLRRSPAAEAASAGAPFEHPQIRDWLSFTPERLHTRSVAVLVGIASRTKDPTLAPFLRPLSGTCGQTPMFGHVHAAAFSYRPLPKGAIELVPTVTNLFTTETLQGVLHLLGDEREGAGDGHSEFLRGACWVAPIAEIIREEGAR